MSWWQGPCSLGVAVCFSLCPHLLPEGQGRDGFIPTVRAFPSSLLAMRAAWEEGDCGLMVLTGGH